MEVVLRSFSARSSTPKTGKSYSLLISDGKLPVSVWFKNNPKQQEKMSLWYLKFLSINSPRLLSLFWSSSSLIIIKATKNAFIKKNTAEPAKMPGSECA